MLVFEDLELDQDGYEVRRDGHLIELSPTEFRLLRYLMLHPGQVLTRTPGKPVTAEAPPGPPPGPDRSGRKS